MRSRHKEWKNGKYSKWTARIIWYQGPAENDIRLALEDNERKLNYFPNSRAIANQVWELFKQHAPSEGQKTPFISSTFQQYLGSPPPPGTVGETVLDGYTEET